MTALWSWRYDDTTLPPAEHYRVHRWLYTHGLDYPRATAARVHAGHGWCEVEADLTVDLPDGSTAVGHRRVAMLTPPPVPWTAAMRRAA